MRKITHVVDNRVFLLELDELYRNLMKQHERTEPLQCARAVCQALGVAPQNGPVEGYYSEDNASPKSGFHGATPGPNPNPKNT